MNEIEQSIQRLKEQASKRGITIHTSKDRQQSVIRSMSLSEQIALRDMFALMGAKK